MQFPEYFFQIFQNVMASPLKPLMNAHRPHSQLNYNDNTYDDSSTRVTMILDEKN